MSLEHISTKGLCLHEFALMFFVATKDFLSAQSISDCRHSSGKSKLQILWWNIGRLGLNLLQLNGSTFLMYLHKNSNTLVHPYLRKLQSVRKMLGGQTTNRFEMVWKENPWPREHEMEEDINESSVVDGIPLASKRKKRNTDSSQKAWHYEHAHDTPPHISFSLVIELLSKTDYYRTASDHFFPHCSTLYRVLPVLSWLIHLLELQSGYAHISKSTD